MKRGKCFLFVVVLCLLNQGMSFLLEPARGSSATMWEEYYREKDINTLFVGSSLCSASFDPLVFDEKMGCKSFNMGTPMQALNQNLTALETALEEHEIDTVVIGMGFFVLQEEAFEEAELSFEKERARKTGGIKGFLRSLDYVYSKDVQGTEKSIHYWFPWTYNVEEYSLQIIRKNVKSKIALLKEKDGTQVSTKGYRPYDGIVDYETASEKNSYHTYNQKLKADLLEGFEKLFVVCKENKVDVIVVNTPHPKFDIYACREVYAKNSEVVIDLCRKHGVSYYDFSLAKSELFDGKKQYFYDFEHLNQEGSKAFSNAMAELLIMRKQGKPVEELFWDAKEYTMTIENPH